MLTIKKLLYICTCIVSILLGTTWFLYQKSWIIFNIPSCLPMHDSFPLNTECKKITIFIWQHNHAYQEHIDLILTNDHQTNIQRIVDQFLQSYQQHKIMNQSIHVQSAILTKNNELFISFNQNPFNKQSSTYQKIMFLKQLWKTLQQLKVNIRCINFLINHKPIDDDQLNFDKPWITNLLI